MSLRYYSMSLSYYGGIKLLRRNYGITARLRHYGKCRNRNAVCRNITASANQLRLTSLPQAPTLRQNYLPSVFDKHYQLLKLLFDSKPVAIIMDETTDDCARSVVNTLFCYRNE